MKDKIVWRSRAYNDVEYSLEYAHKKRDVEQPLF